MNVNRKLGRFKQWAGERMGGEVKTNTSDEFKNLENEMMLRQDGMESLQRSMNMYVKSLSKRNDVEDKEKATAIQYLSSTMIQHGEDFDPDSEYGACLTALGRANERLARTQEGYVSNATSSWLDGLERSLVQMKEYQSARKKLETRRLAYDSSQAKMQKQKKEDFRVEEELRSQRAKYEESSEDVYRRMQDIKEGEAESIVDLTAFMEAELAYHERCREILLQLKRDWPVGSSPPRTENKRRPMSRSNTFDSDRYPSPVHDEPTYERRREVPRVPSRNFGTPDSAASFERHRPALKHRMSSQDIYNRQTGQLSPPPIPRLARAPTEPPTIFAGRQQLRPTKSRDVFADAYDDYQPRSINTSYDRTPPSPSTTGTPLSRNASWSSAEAGSTNSYFRKAPPPPPPSRAKKPPPPPPPMKRVINA